MCLLAVAFGMSARHPLIVAANRDERHARPSLAAHWWADRPDVFAGRDLAANGTWLGASRHGRVAAVTNFHDSDAGPAPESRGRLVADFLAGSASSEEFATHLNSTADRYGPYNLLLFDRHVLVYCSNRANAVVRLGAGVHAISNTALDTEWPKMQTARIGLHGLLSAAAPTEPLLSLLATRSDAPREAGYRNALFIEGPTYGTRSSTVILVDSHGLLSFVERRFAPDGARLGETREQFELPRVPAPA